MMRRWQRADGGIGTGTGTAAGAGIEAGQGVGLGLAIVARYAALLGTRFELVNGPSESTGQAAAGNGLCAELVWPIERLAPVSGLRQPTSQGPHSQA